jgi:hypothetical protein
MNRFDFEVTVEKFTLARFVHQVDGATFAEQWSLRNHAIAHLWDGVGKLIGTWMFGVRQ